MKVLLAMIAVLPLTALAEFVWLPADMPQTVFGDGQQVLKAVIRNSGETTESKDVRVRLYQTGSETMAPVGKAWLWKKLTVLPGQTVLEEITLTLPKVDAEASFRLFWMDDADKTLAQTDFTVHPRHLLRDLSKTAGRHAVGVFDPDNRLRPLMREEEIEFEELTVDGRPEAFRGRLAIILPAKDSPEDMDVFAQNMGRVARERGLALVWFQSPDKRRSGEPPLAYPVHDGRATIVKAPSALMENLEKSPEAQLSLVWLATFAVQQNQMPLPTLSEP